MKKSQPGQTRGLAGGALVGVAGLLAALALVYSNSSGVIDVTDAAAGQHRAQAALTAITASRSALAQTLLIATDEPALATAAVAETRTLFDELDTRVTSLAATADTGTGLNDPLGAVLTTADAALDAIVAGDVDRAAAQAVDTATGFDELTAAVIAVRDHHSAVIAEAASRAGSVATASRFMVALVVPLIGVIIAFVFVRRERRRERLSAELEHERNLNQSKDQLIANLSHELRTPLTGIYTSAMAVEDMGDAEPELSRELNGLIVDQAADLTRMVEDLLVSAQADAGRLHFDCGPTSLVAQLDSVKHEIERMGADITVRVSDADVVVDPGRLRQVLRNLLSNAVRHGGDSISVEGRPDGDVYRLVVADDGAGVPTEVAERMFQRFVHQGDTPLITGSVGLGLAITKVLTEGMDGTIEYERSDGMTRFVMTLPMPPLDGADPPEQATDATEAAEASTGEGPSDGGGPTSATGDGTEPSATEGGEDDFSDHHEPTPTGQEDDPEADTTDSDTTDTDTTDTDTTDTDTDTDTDTTDTDTDTDTDTTDTDTDTDPDTTDTTDTTDPDTTDTTDTDPDTDTTDPDTDTTDTDTDPDTTDTTDPDTTDTTDPDTDPDTTDTTDPDTDTTDTTTDTDTTDTTTTTDPDTTTTTTEDGQDAGRRGVGGANGRRQAATPRPMSRFTRWRSKREVARAARERLRAGGSVKAKQSDAPRNLGA